MKNKRKAFWKNFKFKYKLTITNENTLEEIVGIHVSKLNGVSVLLSAVTVIFLIASLIIVFTPLRNYLPGYMNTEVREQVVTNALRADSLQWLMERQRMYIMNIQDIISGNVKTDSIHSIDSLTVVRSEELMERTQAEDEFRKQYEENEEIKEGQEMPQEKREWVTVKVSQNAVIKRYDKHSFMRMPTGYYGDCTYNVFNDRMKRSTQITDLQSDSRCTRR